MFHRLTQFLKNVAPEDALFSSFPPSDFVPFAAFYDADTLLTKNGELARVICIRARAGGQANEEEGAGSLQEAVRRALTEHVSSDRFAFWFHTRRNRQSVPVPTPPQVPFAQQVHEAWRAQAGFSHVYRNVCYITVVSQGQSAPLLSTQEFKQAGRQQRNRVFRERYLEDASTALAELTSSLLASLSQEFEADVLGVRERGEVMVSEQLEWLVELTTLRAQTMPVMDQDLGHQLACGNLVFGFNVMEARSKRGKRFGTLLSLKHYHELPLALLDRLLQVPCEMVVTQAVDFMPAKEALAKTRAWAETFEMSQDGLIARASGTVSMLEALSGGRTDYVRQQTLVMLMADDLVALEASATMVQQAAAQIGWVLIREDVQQEAAFWAQLPGNFAFLRRQHPMPFSKAGAFMRLNHFPVGEVRSHWGEPVTVFPTRTLTPYLFHFHEGENGHTAFLDYNSFPDRVGHALLHFVLTEASRLAARMVVVDYDHASRLWVRGMGGTVLPVGEADGVRMNPFALPDEKRNRGFLAAWVAQLLDLPLDAMEMRATVKAAVDGVYTDVASEQRCFQALVTQMRLREPAMAEVLRARVEASEMAAWLTDGDDGLDLERALTSIGLTSSPVGKAFVRDMFPYVLHRLASGVDGRPAVLVFREAFALLSHPFVAPRLASLLEMLREQQVVAVFHTRNVEDLTRYPVTPVILQQVATTFYVPDDIDADYLADTVGLPASQHRTLLGMLRQQGEFLLRHGRDFIPSRLHLEAPLHVLDVLAGDERPAVLARKT